jgi:hypothetical protein
MALGRNAISGSFWDHVSALKQNLRQGLGKSQKSGNSHNVQALAGLGGCKVSSNL